MRKLNKNMPDNLKLRRDNGSQYISKQFNNYLKRMGINHVI